MSELKKVKVLNDYVAIIKTIDIPDGIEVDSESLLKHSNEGVICGVGPSCWRDMPPQVAIGDKVIFANKLYLTMMPQSGGYGGLSVVIVKCTDVLVNSGPSAKYTFVSDEA